MIILILKILAGLSLLPFLFIFLVSLKIRLHLPSKNYLGIPWNQVALYKPDGFAWPASELIRHFKINSTGLISAVGLIILGFVTPWIFPPEAIKHPDLQYYLTLGIGLFSGWLAVGGCIHYGNLVRWNLLGVRPPGQWDQ